MNYLDKVMKAYRVVDDILYINCSILRLELISNDKLIAEVAGPSKTLIERVAFVKVKGKWGICGGMAWRGTRFSKGGVVKINKGHSVEWDEKAWKKQQEKKKK